jgi:hypothetical protein
MCRLSTSSSLLGQHQAASNRTAHRQPEEPHSACSCSEPGSSLKDRVRFVRGIQKRAVRVCFARADL